MRTKRCWTAGDLRSFLDHLPRDTPLIVGGEVCLYELGWCCRVDFDADDESVTLAAERYEEDV